MVLSLLEGGDGRVICLKLKYRKGFPAMQTRKCMFSGGSRSSRSASLLKVNDLPISSKFSDLMWRFFTNSISVMRKLLLSQWLLIAPKWCRGPSMDRFCWDVFLALQMYRAKPNPVNILLLSLGCFLWCFITVGSFDFSTTPHFFRLHPNVVNPVIKLEVLRDYLYNIV